MTLVTVALPTHDRAKTLEQALRSALEQTHAELEIVVSDNASSDGTRALCQGLAVADARVVYRRHPENVGPTANFNGLFAACRGEYALMLADDDRLAPDYVERCLAELERRPDHAIVAGLARYERDGRAFTTGRKLTLAADEPSIRLTAYLRSVEDNGTFYGLVRTSALRRAGTMPNVLGNDWLHVAALAYCGKVLTIDTTVIHRTVGGTSDTIGGILETFASGSRLDRWAPYVAIAGRVAAEVGWRSTTYSDRSPGARLTLAVRAAWAAMRWRYTLWHPIRPVVLRLRRRRRARTLVDAIMRRVDDAEPGTRLS